METRRILSRAQCCSLALILRLGIRHQRMQRSEALKGLQGGLAFAGKALISRSVKQWVWVYNGGLQPETLADGS
eukprot:1137628-Pelagomonas_calceolata.AAC.7